MNTKSKFFLLQCCTLFYEHLQIVREAPQSIISQASLCLAFHILDGVLLCFIDWTVLLRKRWRGWIHFIDNLHSTYHRISTWGWKIWGNTCINYRVLAMNLTSVIFNLPCSRDLFSLGFCFTDSDVISESIPPISLFLWRSDMLRLALLSVFQNSCNRKILVNTYSR